MKGSRSGMVVPAAGRQSAKVGLPASGRHYQNPLFEPHRRADVLGGGGGGGGGAPGGVWGPPPPSPPPP
ncbi:MAG: hypothetical protein PBU97_12655 [Stenotrophomonas maltophilia]